jgi:hypothetical protein
MNPFAQMSPEQFAAFLKSRGVSEKQWRQMGTKSFEPSIVKAQRKLLTKLGQTLEKSVEADLQEITRLRMQLAQLEHGGGR